MWSRSYRLWFIDLTQRMHDAQTHQYTQQRVCDKNNVSKQRSNGFWLASGLIYQCDRCTPTRKYTSANAHTHTGTHTHTEAEGVHQLQSLPRETVAQLDTLIKAELCKNPLWSQYSWETRMETEEEKNTRQKRGWTMKRDWLEHPPYEKCPIMYFWFHFIQLVFTYLFTFFHNREAPIVELWEMSRFAMETPMFLLAICRHVVLLLFIILLCSPYFRFLL